MTQVGATADLSNKITMMDLRLKELEEKVAKLETQAQQMSAWRRKAPNLGTMA